MYSYLAILAAHLIWGVNFLAAKIALGEIPPYTLAFLRFTLASLLLLPFLYLEKKKTPLHLPDLPKLIGIGVCMSTLNITMFYLGISKTSVTDASALTLIIPILSILVGWRILKEKIYIVNLVGVLFGIVGTLFILDIPKLLLGQSLVNTQNIPGNILIILSGLFWVIGGVLSKKTAKKYTALDLACVIFGVGAITFLAPSLVENLENPTWYYHLSLLGILSFIFIGVLSTVAAFFLYEMGLKKVGIVKANNLQYVEPLLATTLGVLLLNEQLTYSFIIGVILVGLGAYWSTLAQPNHLHKKSHRH